MTDRHSKEELQGFAAAKETRQLWARDRETEEIVYLEEGRADDFREDCSSGRFVCPIDSCDSPAYSAIGGSRKRHHFRHRQASASVHAPESWLHETGKNWLGQELSRRYPEAQVFIDTKAIDGGQRPDVLVEIPDGRRFAFEVQYSPITVSDWQRRHAGYESEGIVDVWLFGNIPPHLRWTRLQYDAGAITIGDLHQTMVESGLAVHFISPDTRSIGTALVHSGHYMIEPRNCELGIDPLEKCEIEGGTFLTPCDRRERKALEEKEAKRLARLKEAELEETRAAERAARKEKATERAKQRIRVEREQWQSEGAPKFLSLSGLSEMPAIIAEHSAADHCIDGYHGRWHAEFYWRHLREIGGSFSYADAARPYWDAQPKGKKWVNYAITGYLFALKRAGFVCFESVDAWIEGDILVLANFTLPPTPELRNGAERAHLVAFEGHLALVSRTGEPIRRLRPLRPEDDHPTFEELERERQAKEREWLRAEGYLPPLELEEGALCRIDPYLRKGLIQVHMFERYYCSQLRDELRRFAAERPGGYRIDLWLYQKPSLRMRARQLACIAKISSYQEDDLEALIESAIARGLALENGQTEASPLGASRRLLV
jgi:hypothetical protein